jgi:hypothetical protein
VEKRSHLSIGKNLLIGAIKLFSDTNRLIGANKRFSDKKTPKFKVLYEDSGMLKCNFNQWQTFFNDFPWLGAKFWRHLQSLQRFQKTPF